MSVAFKKTIALLEGECSIEDSEELLNWILLNPKGKLNLKKLSYLHTAVLQVLMASQVKISIWPSDTKIASWLQAILLESK
ncbi:MAG: hypothetical protein Q9M92_00975 [Enterobacterales bacterium]|nr:hypothetical protein [Enterobacterales bacterium]